MELPDRSQAKSWEGHDVVDRDGQRLGRCVGVFADTATGQPEWLQIDVDGRGRSFVPALDAAERDGAVRVRFTREAVLGAPSVGDDEQLSKAEEIELYRHYEVPFESGDSVLPADPASATTGDTTPTTAGVAPVAGITDGTTTAASSSSGADTSVAEADADVDGRRVDAGDTTALTPTSGDLDGDGTSALADVDTASGGVVTPATGEELPVLDPAAASVPVPEDQVTYDAPPRDDEAAEPAAAPAAEQPRPALRRVPPASPPPAAPAPSSPAPSSSGSDLSALTPLGAIAGVAAAVALVLRARERRARRRTSPAARAGRLGDSLRAGSAAARASAGSTLAGVSEAAEITRRSASTATARAAKAAAEQQKRAAAASRRQRTQGASALAVASKTAAAQKKALARAAAQQRKAARASLSAAATAAAEQRKAAGTSLAGASKSATKQRKVAASLSGSSSRTSSAAAAPAKVAKRGRKVRKSIARKLWNTLVLGAAGGGYVLGAKAGRQRYDELSQVATAVAESPQVQSATEAVTDPERRADLLAEVQQQAGSLVGRRGEPRI